MDNFCQEHQQAWFKKGKMKNFAHPIKDENGEDTGKWCNKPKDESPKPEASPAPNGKPSVTSGAREADKNRSFALAYAKDLAVAGRVETNRILKVADVFLAWLNGEYNGEAIEVEDNHLVSAIEHTTGAKAEEMASTEQRAELSQLVKDKGNTAQVKAFIKNFYNGREFKDLTITEAKVVLDTVKKGAI